jgi:cullin-associated NEDD8-dissociated protein 1
MPLYFAPQHPKGPDGKPSKDYREIIAIDPNTKVEVSPNRPNADRPAGAWIPGRATFYGATKAWEEGYAKAGKGEPGMWGVIEYGSCGYTESDGKLPYPIDYYIAAADTNEDYPGTCGRCYQVSGERA